MRQHVNWWGLWRGVQGNWQSMPAVRRPDHNIFGQQMTGTQKKEEIRHVNVYNFSMCVYNVTYSVK